MCRCLATGLVLVVAALGGTLPGSSAEEPPGAYGLGRPASDAEIRAWDIDVAPTGEGLPPGQGTVKQGAQVYVLKCAACHGATGREGPQDRLVGGRNTLASAHPVKTVGSYWPYATTLYDYVRRAMPFDAPQSLSPDEVYSVVAWLLHQNGIVPEDVVLDARTLPQIRMPNRDGFIQDPRPDVPRR
ncbi:Cytochrome C [Nitrospira tepida]|uniref:Cytochrome C n=1 Tax=Nitrospira tepida TaxID=2973512 RepID=A0AA86MSC1_9BACT|nr:cytochrome c [Nitrospira tepida]CAI4029607.1 Cytochrome C [Nitrospira tepida]